MLTGWRVACVAAVVGGWLARADAPPEAVSIPACEQAPRLDGRLDDAAWRTAAELGGFYGKGSDAVVPGTRVRLTRDAAWLYVGAECGNPRLDHVAQKIYEHDGPVQADDSLELLIRPDGGAASEYYHFRMNFAGVAGEQRCAAQGVRDLGWDPPWRHAVRRQADGWTAEWAIPFFCLGQADLSRMTINMGRTLVRVELDDYGAKRDETRQFGALKRAFQGSFHDPANFLPVRGLDGFVPETPFAPRIARADLEGVRQADGATVYDLAVSVEAATPVAGSLRLEVREDFGEGETTAFAQPVTLSGRTHLALTLPAGNLRERRIRVVLLDEAGASLLGSAEARNAEILTVLKDVYAGRSYYSVETHADIRVELGLPPGLLAGARLALDRDGAPLAEWTDLQPVMTGTVPVAALAEGENLVTVRVMLDGRELASRRVRVVRLTPRPGYETKTDFIRGVWLKDQQPFFPMGIVGHTLQNRLGLQDSPEDDEPLFRYLAQEIGMNCVMRTSGATDPARFMACADKYGLYVISWKYPVVFYPMNMMKSRLGAKLDFGSLDLPDPIRQALASDPGVWTGINGSLPLNDRLRFRKAVYDRLKPEAVADAEQWRQHKNFIAYYNVDEPNLVNPDDRIAAAEWHWNTLQEADPHRPTMLLYARQIPHGENWTRWGDMLGYDVYPEAYRSGVYNDPGLGTAYYAHALRERCRQDHKVMFFVPLSNTMDPVRAPIGLSRAQMLCQAYAAIIYGARGLLYFALSNVVGPDAWDALRTLCAQVRTLTPALVNGDVPQTLRYTPDTLDPRAQSFPMVNAALFRYPDGAYLLMAVNIKTHAVDTTFRVGRALGAERLFDGAAPVPLAIEGGAFADTLEPYGVRAYRLRLEDGPAAPVEVALEMTPLVDRRADGVDIDGLIRQLMMSRNHMPNPCFERQTNPGVPDYSRPYFCLSTDPYWGQKGRSDWYLDDAVTWNGRPSLRMLRRAYTRGGYKTRGLMSVYYPPALAKPVTMTFSFYAKSDDPRAHLGVLGMGKLVSLGGFSAEWKRHHMTFDVKPSASDAPPGRMFMLLPSEGSVIWINGLQVEQGDTPTEFRDDSVLVERVVVSEPGNLVSNPGAEGASADSWSGLEAAKRGEPGVRRGQGRTGDFAFYWNGQSIQVLSDWIDVDTNAAYEVSGWFKTESGAAPALVMGMALGDAERRPIKHWNVFSIPGTQTELAEACRPDDRMLRLKDASGWKPGTSFVAAFGVGENQYTQDVAPPGIDEVRPDGDTWLVTLGTACGQSRPAGTPVTENRAGNNGLYFGVGKSEPAADGWTQVRGVITPRQWWPGTARARLMIIPKAGTALWMDDFVCRKTP